MGDEVISSPEKGEVGKVGKVGETYPQTYPHHHLPSRREVGGVEVGKGGFGEVRKNAAVWNAIMTAGHVVGIDLGAAGAVSLLDADGRLIDVRDLPCLPDGPRARPSVSASAFAEILREWRPERAIVEFVSSRPTDSPMSAFAFGMARATVMSTLEVLGISAGFITVPAWKRQIGIGAGRGQKSTARAEATRRWPEHATTFARAKDDGRAESALIALAGLMRERAGR